MNFTLPLLLPSCVESTLVIVCDDANKGSNGTSGLDAELSEDSGEDTDGGLLRPLGPFIPRVTARDKRKRLSRLGFRRFFHIRQTEKKANATKPAAQAAEPKRSSEIFLGFYIFLV